MDRLRGFLLWFVFLPASMLPVAVQSRRCPPKALFTINGQEYSTCPTHPAFKADPAKLVVGEPLKMTCRVDCDMYERINPGRNCSSKHMYIGKARKEVNSVVMDNITIEYALDAVPLDAGGTYFCYMRDTKNPPGSKFLSHTQVEVGELQHAKYLDCISPNWEGGICKWCEGDTYKGWKVQYLVGSTGNWSDCPENSTLCSCKWTFRTGFSRHYMNISISGSNQYGDTHETFMVDFMNQSLIVPNPVDWVKIINVGSQEMSVEFEGPNHLQGLLHLTYHVSLQSKFDSEPMVIEFDDKQKRRELRKFTDLIPYVFYTAKVKVRPSRGQHWSNISTETERTLMDVPERSPETRPSSFQETLCGDDCRTVTIYYKDIPERYTSGIINGAKATFRGERIDRTLPCKNKERTCEIKRLPAASSFSVHIQASTEIGWGSEKNAQALEIYKHVPDSPPPEHLVGEVQNKTEREAVIKFIWSYAEKPDNFILYYRHLQDGIPEGGLNWLVLDGSLNNSAEVVIDLDGKKLGNYQFAIAAEKSGKSAGMSKSFLSCIYDVNGEKPVLNELKFERKKQDAQSLKIDLLPQMCKPRHRQIVAILINILEVTAAGELISGGQGLNTSERIVAPHEEVQHTVADLKDYTYYNISLTAICRDGSACQHLPGVKLRTNPATFPAWAIGIIVVLILLIALGLALLMRYYKKVTDKKKLLSIQRTPAVAKTEELEENGNVDEYYIISGFDRRMDRSESESSSSDGDHTINREQTRLIQNGKLRAPIHPRRLMSHESAGSGHSAMTDVTYLPSESDSDEVYLGLGGSPRSLGPISHAPDLQPVPEAVEDGKKPNSPGNDYSTINNDPCGEVFVDIGDGLARARPGPHVFSRPQNAPAHILPRPEPRPNWETRHGPRSHPESRGVKFKEPPANGCVFKKSASPGNDSTGATGGDSDEEYCKLTTNPNLNDHDPGDLDSEGYLKPKPVDELDSEGYLKAKSSSGESADEQDRKPEPPRLLFQDRDFGSSSSSDGSDDEDSYVKVTHQDPILGPGGYVQRDETPRSTPTRTFTPIEQGPNGYCTISPSVSPRRSQENLSRNQEFPILNIQANVDPLPPFSRPGGDQRSDASCPPVYVQSPDSPPRPVVNGTIPNGTGNFGLTNTHTPRVSDNGYVQHPDPVVLGQEPSNFPRHLNGCLGVPGEYDSEDDSSTTLSDSGHHSGGFPQSLRGMPINDGYVQRPDQCRDQDNSAGGQVKNTEPNSDSHNPSTVHSRPNCNGNVPNHQTQNGYISNCSEPPALIPAPHLLNSNNSNSNTTGYVQSVEPCNTQTDVDNPQPCATLPLSTEDVPVMLDDGETPTEQSNDITSKKSPSQLANGYVDHSVLTGMSDPPSGDHDIDFENLQCSVSDSSDSSEDEEEEEDSHGIIVNPSSYVHAQDAMNVC